jgi:thioesterase domain-containing protein
MHPQQHVPIDHEALRDAMRLAVERELLADIPITHAMQLSIAAWDGESLSMAAPLGPNVNDKGCAFGGSLASVMTLAGWALVRLAIDQHGMDCDIFVQDSTIRYLAPVWNDFVAEARIDDEDSFSDFFNTLSTRGKARLTVRCEVRLPDGGIATALTARFVALERARAPRDRDTAQSALGTEV